MIKTKIIKKPKGTTATGGTTYTGISSTGAPSSGNADHASEADHAIEADHAAQADRSNLAAVAEIANDLAADAPALKDLDGKYISKLTDDTAKGVITFEKQTEFAGGFSAYGLDPEHSPLPGIGRGAGVYKDGEDSVLIVDKAIVRKEFQVNTLTINQIMARGGMTVESCANGTIKEVVSVNDTARLQELGLQTWAEENMDDEDWLCILDIPEGLYNTYAEDDIAWCSRFDENNNTVKYYRRAVLATLTGIPGGLNPQGVKAVVLNGSYISTDYVDGSGIPAEGDAIVQWGNLTDKARQHVCVRDVYGGGYEARYKGLDAANAAGVLYHYSGYRSGKPYELFGTKDGHYVEWDDGQLNVAGNIKISSGGSTTDVTEYIDSKLDGVVSHGVYAQYSVDCNNWYAVNTPDDKWIRMGESVNGPWGVPMPIGKGATGDGVIFHTAVSASKNAGASELSWGATGLMQTAQAGQYLYIQFGTRINGVEDYAETCVRLTGDDGSVYRLDLDNEMICVPADAQGKVLGGGEIVVTARVFKGSEAVKQADTGTTMSVDSVSGYGPYDYKWNTADNAVECFFNLANIPQNGSVWRIPVTAHIKEKGVEVETLTSYINFTKVMPGATGATGATPDVYSLELDADQIVKNFEGALNPSTIHAYKYKRAAGGAPQTTTELILTCTQRDADGNSLGTTTVAAVGASSGSVAVNKSAYQIVFELKDGNNALWDRERVCVISDASDMEVTTDNILTGTNQGVRGWRVCGYTPKDVTKNGTTIKGVDIGSIMPQSAGSVGEWVKISFDDYKSASLINARLREGGYSAVGTIRPQDIRFNAFMTAKHPAELARGKYILSFIAKFEGNNYANMRMTVSLTDGTSPHTIATAKAVEGASVRYAIPFELTSAYTAKEFNIFFQYPSSSTYDVTLPSSVTIGDVMLQKGNVLTPWAPAALDANYLMQALRMESTDISGGLMLTTMILLGQTGEDGERVNNAGIMGVMGRNGEVTPMIWAGGDAVNNADDTAFIVYSDGTVKASGGVLRLASDKVRVGDNVELTTTGLNATNKAGSLVFQITNEELSDIDTLMNSVTTSVGTLSGNLGLTFRHVAKTSSATGGVVSIQAPEGYYLKPNSDLAEIKINNGAEITAEMAYLSYKLHLGPINGVYPGQAEFRAKFALELQMKVGNAWKAVTRSIAEFTSTSDTRVLEYSASLISGNAYRLMLKAMSSGMLSSGEDVPATVSASTYANECNITSKVSDRAIMAANGIFSVWGGLAVLHKAGRLQVKGSNLNLAIDGSSVKGKINGVEIGVSQSSDGKDIFEMKGSGMRLYMKDNTDMELKVVDGRIYVASGQTLLRSGKAGLRLGSNGDVQTYLYETATSERKKWKAIADSNSYSGDYE